MSTNVTGQWVPRGQRSIGLHEQIQVLKDELSELEHSWGFLRFLLHLLRKEQADTNDYHSTSGNDQENKAPGLGEGISVGYPPIAKSDRQELYSRSRLTIEIERARADLATTQRQCIKCRDYLRALQFLHELQETNPEEIFFNVCHRQRIACRLSFIQVGSSNTSEPSGKCQYTTALTPTDEFRKITRETIYLPIHVDKEVHFQSYPTITHETTTETTTEPRCQT